MWHVRVCADSSLRIRVSAHVFTHVRARVGVRAVVCTCVQMGHASGVGEGGACSGVDMWHKGPGL